MKYERNVNIVNDATEEESVSVQVILELNKSDIDQQYQDTLKHYQQHGVVEGYALGEVPIEQVIALMGTSLMHRVTTDAVDSHIRQIAKDHGDFLVGLPVYHLLREDDKTTTVRVFYIRKLGETK